MKSTLASNLFLNALNLVLISFFTTFIHFNIFITSMRLRMSVQNPLEASEVACILRLSLYNFLTLFYSLIV